MSGYPKVFVDAMVWIAAFDKDHEDHQYANQTLTKYVGRNQNNSIFLSDYVFNETLSYITRRQKDRARPISKENRQKFVSLMNTDVYNSRFVKILKVTEEHIGTGMTFMKNNPHLTASLTDWTSLLLMEENQIRFILTFDKDIVDILNSITPFKNMKVWKY